MTLIRTIVGLLILATLPVPAAPPSKAPFEVRHIVAFGRRVDTHFYDFTGDGLADALMVSIDMDADPPSRWLALHVATKAGIPEKPDQIWSAAPTTCALALSNAVPEGGTDILEIAPDGVTYHAYEKDAMTEEPRKLIHTRTFFTTPSSRALPTWMGPVDLTNDKLDDLVVPVPDGYKVYFQTEPGRYGHVVRLEADLAAGQNPAMSPARFAADWERLIARGLPPTAAQFNLHDELPRLAAVDLDGDGLKELVSIRGDQITIFKQDPVQRFPARRRSQFRILTLVEERKKDAVSVADVQFCDIDGDQNLDLIVTKIEGELGLLDSIKTRIYPHLGTGRGNFMADKSIFIDGISLNPTFMDMDGDGTLDVMTSRLRTDIIAKGAERLAFGDITTTYEVFQFDRASRVYMTTPVWSYDVRIRTEDISKRRAASRPLIQVAGDLSGDKRPDAVYYDLKATTLEVRKGRAVWEAGGGRQLISFSPDASARFSIDSVSPHDPKWISYMDMDGDGRQDILLNFNSQIIYLLSRF
jgi:hypothetical protein